jgi:hypothetical protein
MCRGGRSGRKSISVVYFKDQSEAENLDQRLFDFLNTKRYFPFIIADDEGKIYSVNSSFAYALPL